MGTRTFFQHREEEQKEERQQSLHMTSTTSKKKFKTSDEEETFTLSELSIAAALALASEKPPDYKLKREAAILELEQRGQKRVRFGNDMEKLEKEVIRNCRLLRVRADRKALRRKVRHRKNSDISMGSRNAPGLALPPLNPKADQVLGQPQNHEK